MPISWHDHSTPRTCDPSNRSPLFRELQNHLGLLHLQLYQPFRKQPQEKSAKMAARAHAMLDFWCAS
eukprot:6642966-Prorocentrum_lima.AAC.1